MLLDSSVLYWAFLAPHCSFAASSNYRATMLPSYLRMQPSILIDLQWFMLNEGGDLLSSYLSDMPVVPTTRRLQHLP
jgi:hypothetical protein